MNNENKRFCCLESRRCALKCSAASTCGKTCHPPASIPNSTVKKLSVLLIQNPPPLLHINHPHFPSHPTSILHPLVSHALSLHPTPPVSILQLSIVNKSLTNSSSSNTPMSINLIRLSRMRGNGRRSNQRGCGMESCMDVGWSVSGWEGCAGGDGVCRQDVQVSERVRPLR